MIAISKINIPILHINLDYTVITVEKRGTYNNEDIFSWSSIEPTESTEVNYRSTIVNEEQLIRRLSLISYSKDLLPEEQYAINIFLNKNTDED